MDKVFEDIIDALLAMKTGLAEAVTPSLRAVTVNLDIDREIFICNFFYDGPIDDYLFDLASCAASEASNCWYLDAHYIQLDFPSPIPVNGNLAYLRKEPEKLPPQVSLLPRSPTTIAIAHLTYATQQGLLGRVMPSLRYVSICVNEEKKILSFFFYYDEKITEELLQLSKETVHVAKQAFPDSFCATESTIFYPFPKRIPSIIDSCGVYARNESLPIMKATFYDISGAKYWMYCALYRTVTPSLRAVTVDLDIKRKTYFCRFFYDGPISKDDEDLAQLATAEASGSWTRNSKCTRLDYPKAIPQQGALAYLRYEIGMHIPNEPLLAKSPDITVFILHLPASAPWASNCFAKGNHCRY
jgi:hypothetical protein